MWMEKNKTGFVFRETFVDPLTGKRHKVSVTMPSSSRVAQKAAREKLDQLIAEKKAAEAPTKLFELIDDYMVAQRPFVKPTTYKNYVTVRTKLLQFFPIDTLVGKLTPAMVQKVLDEIVLKNSPVYAGKILTLLRRSLDRAYKLNIIHSMEVVNRVEIKRPPKTIQDVESQREKFLSRLELKEVLAALRKVSPLIADVCELQSRTGLRFGELAALRDEDFEGNSLYVNGTLQWGLGKGKQPVRGTPKNVYSIRHVALDRRSKEIVEHYMLKNKRCRAWDPTSHDEAGEQWIFCTREGGPLDISFVNHALKKIKFPKKLTTHIFRHTHISLLAEQGVPLKAIMQRVGHNDPTTTMAIYTHVTEDMADQAVKALDSLS